MGPQGSVFEGKSLDEAVRKGLDALGLSRAEVVITMLEEGSNGFFGLGARPYRVRVAARPGGAISEPVERSPRRERGRRDEGRGRGGRDDRRGRGGRSEGRGEARGERRDRGGEGRRHEARRDEPRGERRPEGRGEPRGEARVEPRAERGGERRDGRRDEPRDVVGREGAGREAGAREGGRRDEPRRDEPRRERRDRGRDGRRERMPAEPVAEEREVMRPAEAPMPIAAEARERGDRERGDDDDAAGDRRRRRRGRRGGRRRRGEGLEAPALGAPAGAAVAEFEGAVAETYERPAEPARERVESVAVATAEATPGLGAEQLAMEGRRWTEKFLQAMGFEPQVSAKAEGDRVEVTVQVGEGERLLTGDKGEVRQALQHLLNRMVNSGEGSRYHLQLEINDFWRQRETELETLARDMAGRAVEAQDEVVSEYLNAQERRIIHVTLRDDARVKTYAIGTGMIKRIAVAPAHLDKGERDSE
jgi:predicted RNA-binding protein Jag